MEANPREALLEAWMAMTVQIRGNRLLETFSLNEMLLLSALYRRQDAGGPPLTATELCESTQLLKSQVNHIIAALEDRGLLRRMRSQEDRRVVHLLLSAEAIDLYRREHVRVLEILTAVCGAVGEDGARQLTDLLHTATAAVAQFQKHKE